MTGIDPLISVIIPTYNRANVLERAINSALKQTHQNLEVLVVNDGSTDNTSKTVNNFDDRRINYFQHNSNKGANTARNLGIRKSNGQYVAFLDDDDYWHKRKIELQLKKFRESEDDVGIVYCKVAVVRKNKKKFVTTPDIEGYVFKDALRMELNEAINSSMLFRRYYLQKVMPLDESLPGAQDTDLVIQLSKFCRFKYVDKILVFKESSEKSINSSVNKDVGRVMVLKKHSKLYDKFFPSTKRSLLGMSYLSSGKKRIRKEDFFKGFLDFLKAVFYSPLRFVKYCYGFLKRRL